MPGSIGESLMPVAAKMRCSPGAIISTVQTLRRSALGAQFVFEQVLSLGIVLRPHAAELLAAEALDGGGRDDGLGAAADADVGVDARVGQAGGDGGRHVAVADQPHAAADAAQRVDDRLVPRPIEHDDHQVADPFAQLAGDDAQVGLQRRVDLHADVALGHGLADGDLFHVVRRDRREQVAAGRRSAMRTC